MIQKGTNLIPMDKNGVWNVCTFHLYGGFFKKNSTVGGFLKISVKKIKNNKWLVKKTKSKSIIILTRFNLKKNDFSMIKFKINSCLLLKKRLSPIGQIIFGPSIILIRRKKFIYSFSGIL